MSERLSEEQIREIEDRASKATAGPWEVQTVTIDDSIVSRGVRQERGSGINRGDDGYEFFGEEDAAFIAHARTDIPALLSALRAESQAVADLRGKVAGLEGES